MSYIELFGVRKIVYSNIVDYPGMHFRGILSKTRLAVGQLSFHLHRLQKESLVEKFGNDRYCRYFSVGFEPKDKIIISCLREKNSRIILLKMLEQKSVRQIDLSRKIGLTPSTVNWYFKRLERHGILNKSDDGKNYLISQREDLVRILRDYKKSFLDSLVDKFVDTWEF